MGFIYVFEYMVGLAVFGLSWWLFNGAIKDPLENFSTQGNLFELISYLWVAILFIYLIFGGIWLARKYNEREYRGGNSF